VRLAPVARDTADQRQRAWPIGTTRSVRPLLFTTDEALLDDLLRLAAAATVEVDVVPDVGTARSAWATAALVVLGSDVASEVARARLPRREDVVVVGLDRDGAGVWEVAVLVGAARVVFLPEAEEWLAGRLADCAEQDGPDAPVLCTVGGRGGAGSSTLAAALATVSSSQGRRTMLIDGDPLGGGIDLLLGGEDIVGTRWPQLASTRGRVSAVALAEGLPKVGELAVLSWDRADGVVVDPAAMSAVLQAARRSTDVVVVDLPRALDGAAREALACAALTLVVVPAEVRATAAAARVSASVCALTDDVRVVVRGPAPSGLPAEAVADALGLPLAGYLRPERGLAGAIERGDPPRRRLRSPLTKLCQTMIDELVHRRAA
jgi:secretion/DNA translocation related CpaE-like protein